MEKVETTKLTPMMRQYAEIKKEHSDKVLFFRLGDFYEMFDEDAVEVSRLLNLTLTHRGTSPMCGIPYHAATGYLKRLLDAGKKVAVCEQTLLPESSGRELAKREVVQVYTPGTVVDDEYLDSFSDNYIVAANVVKGECFAACCDMSKGDFTLRRLGKDARHAPLAALLSSLSVSEIVVPDDLYFTDKAFREQIDNAVRIVTKLPAWRFSAKEGRDQVLERFGTESLAPFGLSDKDPLLTVAGALLRYMGEMSKSDMAQISNIRVATGEGVLAMDDSTIRNLEITRSMQNGSSACTLFSAVDQTRTAAGARALKEALLSPLSDARAINDRLDWTGRLHDDIDERERVRNLLSSSADLVRLCSKLEMGRSVVRDLTAIKESLFSFFSLVGEKEDYLRLMEGELDDPGALTDLCAEIERTINPECTNAMKSGTVVLPGADAELDELRSVHANSSSLLDEYLSKVKAETGLNILKLGENRVTGMYLEVPKGQLSKVPDYFVRRQTLVGGERFTTPELSELEDKINNAQADADAREREIYNALVKKAASLTGDLLKIGNLFSKLDLYQSFATTAALHGYTRPEIVEEGELVIEGGRHPVVEQHLDSGSFVSNGFSSEGFRFSLITGPNMAGKSTYLRQTALIVLLAHAGSFVPATRAVVPLTDRVFCRVGASDNLAKGESTFLVEMQEASYILRNATRRSFVIMDEIGRGTSTQDGMSIAYAIMRALERTGCVTLFATHYHELTMMDTSGMRLLTLEVGQDKSGIVFLRKVVEGVAESSYGLHVAKLAGIPSSVIREAAAFQRKHFADYQMSLTDNQLDLFVDTSSAPSGEKDAILDEIADFDVSSSTPLEALVELGKLQEMVAKLGK